MRIHITAIGLAAVMLALGACSSSTAGSGGTLEGVTWALTSFVVNGEKQAVPEGVTVDATFQAADSTVSGSGGCNRYFGSYTVDGASLTIGQLGSTEMACQGPGSEIESIYLAALPLVRSFTATTEALTLFDESGAAILEYAVAQPAELGGVTWHATGINNGRGGVESVVAGTDPTATFDTTAGTVSGDAGCNQYNGSVAIDGAAITIGPLMSTKMACADDAATAQEGSFFVALEAATTFEVRGTTLELRDDTGALQVSFEAS